MANVKATMTDIKVIIREFYRGTSLREIEHKLKLSRTSLRNYRSRAKATKHEYARTSKSNRCRTTIHILCLIGLSGNDPNFLEWIGWLRDIMGNNDAPVYLGNDFWQLYHFFQLTI